MKYRVFDLKGVRGIFVEKITEYTPNGCLFTVEANSEKEAYEEAVRLNNKRYSRWISRWLINNSKPEEYISDIKGLLYLNDTKQSTIDEIMDEVNSILPYIQADEKFDLKPYGEGFTLYVQ